MKVLVATIIAAFSVAAYAADKPKLTKEERAARHKAHIENVLGGIVEVERADSKRVVLADAQKVVSSDQMAATIKAMKNLTMLPIVRQEVTLGSEFAGVKAMSLLGPKVGAVILVVDVKDYPTVMVAPEQSWSLVNVGALSSDGASAEVVAKRVNKEIWRATAIMLGASDSMFQPCLMQSINSLKELDDIALTTISPEPLQNMSLAAKKIGILPAHRGTYRAACMHGWAPLPTNDVQKAIWDEVHKLPDQPLTIEFDKKKGK